MTHTSGPLPPMDEEVLRRAREQLEVTDYTPEEIEEEIAKGWFVCFMTKPRPPAPPNAPAGSADGTAPNPEP